MMTHQPYAVATGIDRMSMAVLLKSPLPVPILRRLTEGDLELDGIPIGLRHRSTPRDDVVVIDPRHPERIRVHIPARMAWMCGVTEAINAVGILLRPAGVDRMQVNYVELTVDFQGLPNLNEDFLGHLSLLHKHSSLG